MAELDAPCRRLAESPASADRGGGWFSHSARPSGRHLLQRLPARSARKLERPPTSRALSGGRTGSRPLAEELTRHDQVATGKLGLGKARACPRIASRSRRRRVPPIVIPQRRRRFGGEAIAERSSAATVRAEAARLSGSAATRQVSEQRGRSPQRRRNSLRPTATPARRRPLELGGASRRDAEPCRICYCRASCGAEQERRSVLT